MSRKCGLRCAHCSVNAQPAISERELAFDEWADIISRFADQGGREVVFTGGEPLLYRGLENLVELAKGRGLRIRVYTAAYGLDPRALRILSQTDLVCVSVEGDEATHDQLTGIPGSYQSTLRGLNRLKSIVPIRLHFTAMATNYRAFPTVVSLAEMIGVESLKVFRFTPQGRGHENRNVLSLTPVMKSEFEETVRLARRSSAIQIEFGGEPVAGTLCSVGSKLLITSDGTSLPCLGLRDCSWLSAGNAADSSFADLTARLDEIRQEPGCLCARVHAEA